MEDFFEDVLDEDGQAFFRRTLTFEAPKAQESFHFRVAAGKQVKRESAELFVIDQLRLRMDGDRKALVREGDPAELLIPLTLSAGRSTLTLEYQW